MKRNAAITLSSLVVFTAFSALSNADSLVLAPTTSQTEVEIKFIRGGRSVVNLPGDLRQSLRIEALVNTKRIPLEVKKRNGTLYTNIPNGAVYVSGQWKQSSATSSSTASSVLYTALSVLPRPYGGFSGRKTGVGVELLQSDGTGSFRILALKDGKPLTNAKLNVDLGNKNSYEFWTDGQGFTESIDVTGPFVARLADEAQPVSKRVRLSATLSGTFTPPAFLTEFYNLRNRYESESKALSKEGAKELKVAKTEAERESVELKIRSRDRALFAQYVPKMMDSMRSHAQEEACVNALGWVLIRSFGDYDEAQELLQKHHLFHPVLLEKQRFLQNAPRYWSEPLLKEQLGSPQLPADLKPKLLYYLALTKKNNSGWPFYLLRMTPESVEEWTEICGPKTMSGLKQMDSKSVLGEAIDIFESLKQDYPSYRIAEEDQSLVSLVTAQLFEINNLREGAVAPEIDGQDINGKPMKLSDFRGKVTVISFWASWCGPCMRLVPEEIELIRSFAGRPFAFVGVNGDDNWNQAKAVCDEKKIPWRSFWNVGGASGSIPRKWNVLGWPTIYVLDENGVIQGRDVFGADLRRLLEKLVSDLEARTKRKD